MLEADAQVSELAGELQRVLSKVLAVLRHTGRTSTSGDLTLAQLSILLTLFDQGPMRMTELAAHERVRTPTTTVAIRRCHEPDTAVQVLFVVGVLERQHPVTHSRERFKAF